MPIEYSNPKPHTPGGLYSVMTRVRGGSELIYLCGMAVKGDPDDPAPDEFDRQCNKIFRNIGLALASAGANYENIVQFTTYLVNRDDIPKYVAYRKREYPKMFPNQKYPPNTLSVVDSLMDEAWRIEIHTVAAL